MQLKDSCNPMFGKHHSEETRAKIKKARLGQSPPMLGRHQSEETKAKIKAKLIGRQLSEDHKAKMKNRQISKETRAKMRRAHSGSRNHNFGKHLSEEAKAKIRAKKIGKHPSDETRAKLGGRIEELNPAWTGNNAKPETGRNRAQRMFKCPKGLLRHHIDGNPLNNAPENIKIQTHKQHSILHNGGKHLSDETKAKLRTKMLGKRKGSSNPMFGKHHSEKTKAKMRESMLGRKK